jgi:YidC/Oxa1 family membrane protein insertase
MSNEKRFILFLVLSLSSVILIQFAMEATGLAPRRKRPQPAAPAQAQAEPGDARPAHTAPPDAAASADIDQNQAAAHPDKDPGALKKPRVEAVDPEALVLGSTRRQGPSGYLLELQLTQHGAAVDSIASARYEAEFEGKNPHRPMHLLQHRAAPPSFGIAIVSLGDKPDAEVKGEIPLDQMMWEVVRDDQNRIVRPIPADAAAEPAAKGSAVVFRTTVGAPAVTVTKTYRLLKGSNGFEMELAFASPEAKQQVVYKLIGPHGVPIEGEWYTGTFRDAFFGQLSGAKTNIATKSANDIAKAKQPEHYQSSPLRFAGIENQYFAVLVEPDPLPTNDESRWETDAVATVLDADPKALQKADIGLEITSKPLAVGPNAPRTQRFKVFAGPKTADALAPYAAQGLASYRKVGWFGIPFAPEVAGVISPLLDQIYRFTASVARQFGGTRGNYGISIILLTLFVRLCMFPLGRKQAYTAKRMQDLQPLLKEIQEKYKDDKEQQTRETFALYKRHKVNPMSGCLPALVQLPIFVGLWQALNTSVHLRQASFLYIQNLAAPDMLFRFPVEVPLLGRYFNLLPFLVVTLMLVQTKLFSPPATTPEAEMQQKMMKYMMIFMAFMFYKVPSGLGLYFITSSLWQISERLLLPKMQAGKPAAGNLGDDRLPGDGKSHPGGDGRSPRDGNGPPKPPGKLAQLWEKVLDEAKKDPTYRKVMGEAEPDQGRDRDRRGDRDRPRARPGRRR